MPADPSLSQNTLTFIIGGSEGIGLAIAEALIGKGSSVVIASRSSFKLKSALTHLETKRRSPQQQIGSFICDVKDFAFLDHQISAAVQTYGAPECLVNCAGLAYPGYLENLPMENLRDMMETNYFGTVHAVKLLLPHFLKARKGQIVNVSSVAGFLGLFGYTGYCASKYAVIGFSEALRHELKPYGIRVSVLCPPNTQTPGLKRENQAKPAEVLAIEEKVKTHSAAEVAETLLRELPKNKFLIIPGRDAKLAYLVNRWVPDCFARLFLQRPHSSSPIAR